MQVARMARGNRRRNLPNKLLEAALALRLELRYGKDEIMALWQDHAPFGGNTVGVSAACRRYFGRSPAELSWAEAATLAVLPNSPALIHPGRSRAALRRKRDALLADLHRLGHLSETDRSLATEEPLPRRVAPLPQSAPHLLNRLVAGGHRGRIQTTLDGELQRRLNRLAEEYGERMAGNQIGNLAILVTDVATRETLAYVGNRPGTNVAGGRVDVITAPRSPGSLLKPLLYAAALEEGSLLPRQLLADVPVRFGSYQPGNFNQGFDGAVPANEALARSLNIPFVLLLRDYGTERFHDLLQRFGFAQINRPADHYGLSLILGGAEVTLEEISGWFVGLARQQRYFRERQSRYDPRDWAGPRYLLGPLPAGSHTDRSPLGAGAGFATLQALRELRRPGVAGAYRQFTSRRPVAWKTGTSFGFRDAWAVGATPDYVVGVWVGNADGRGRPGLVGVEAAAPLLFRVLRLLDQRPAGGPRWFAPPRDDQREVTTCRSSGLLAGPDCPPRTDWVPRHAERGKACPYHRRGFVSADGRRELFAGCVGWAGRREQRFFELPPDQAYYYRPRHPEYAPPPPVAPGCGPRSNSATPAMRFVYPLPGGRIRPARDWRGRRGPVVFELAHQQPERDVYWHLDGAYVATTRDLHTLPVELPPGLHRVVVVDETGARLECSVRVEE